MLFRGLALANPRYRGSTALNYQGVTGMGADVLATSQGVTGMGADVLAATQGVTGMGADVFASV